jgi:hypothetical protein
MTVSDDEILERVAALPRHDAEPELVERIRTAAVAEFSKAKPERIAPAPARSDLWTRFVEPALVLASVVAYLSWTASTLSSHVLDAGGVPGAGKRVSPAIRVPSR